MRHTPSALFSRHAADQAGSGDSTIVVPCGEPLHAARAFMGHGVAGHTRSPARRSLRRPERCGRPEAHQPNDPGEHTLISSADPRLLARDELHADFDNAGGDAAGGSLADWIARSLPVED